VERDGTREGTPWARATHENEVDARREHGDEGGGGGGADRGREVAETQLHL
jgi:hypothetical protein